MGDDAYNTQGVFRGCGWDTVEIPARVEGLGLRGNDCGTIISISVGSSKDMQMLISEVVHRALVKGMSRTEIRNQGCRTPRPEGLERKRGTQIGYSDL